MSNVPFHHRSMESLATALRAGAITATQLTDYYLARIAKYNPLLNCYLHVDAESARAAAHAADKRLATDKPLSDLDGMPIAIKNNIDVAGLPTTAGIGARRDYIATTDAPVITSLRNAGAIILGTLNMHEAALGATTDNVAYGRCHNPHKTGYTPGGSSGGSGSAVAAGLCAAALGSDTLGSIRIPSSFCGIYGLKPTNGVISNDGAVPMTHRFDCIGPMARHVKDLRLMWSAMTTPVAATPIKRVARLAHVNNVALEKSVHDAYQLAEALLEGSGLTIETHSLPEMDPAKALQAGLVITERDALAFHKADIEKNPEGFTPELRAFLNFGATLTDADVAAANALVDQVSHSMHAVLQVCDAILLPVTPCAPFPFSSKMPENIAHFTMLANMAGLPAVTVPCGWSNDSLPVGVQIVGRPNSEMALLDLATTLDAAAGGYQFPADFNEEGEAA
jgi:aspartyl-tRNA(Asn)/glutamyl-tRNA(Gln) amidotransferase subunit A